MPIDNDNNSSTASSTPPPPSTDTAQGAAPAAPAPSTPSASSAPAPVDQSKPGTTPSGEQPGSTPNEPRPKSALEAVKKVMASDRTKAAATATEQQPNAPQPQNGEQPPKPAAGSTPAPQHPHENLLGKIDDAEWKALTPVMRARINAFRTTLKNYDSSLRSSAPKAKAYDDLTAWCSGNKMSREDFQFGLEFVANVHRDPARAWQSLQPILTYLRATVGEELPADIQQRVTSGEISEQAGKELARARAGSKISNDQLEAERRDRDERARAEASVRERTSLTNAVRGWEQRFKSSDPDYARKWERVWDRMMTIIQTERPQLTPQLVVQIADRARKDVESWLAGVLPARQIREVKTVVGGASASAQPEPKTALEAAKRALTRRAA